MPEYVLNRNHTLSTKLGHRAVFIKGKPTFVPPIIEREAIALGAERADGSDKPDVNLQLPEGVGERSHDEIKGALIAAFDLITERNDPKDFTAQGVPTVKAVERITEIDVDRGTVAETWAEYRLAKSGE
jgi:hypothetical protein